MNLYAILILSAILLRTAIDLFAEWLNLKALRPDLPPQFEGLYDQEKYRKSQEYTRVRIHFSYVETAIQLTVLVLFWFLGGFNSLDQWIRSWGWGPIMTGLFFMGILMIASSLLSLPFQIYSTFVIEERFGFNRTTPATFIMDRLKALALGVIIGAPLLAAILWFFNFAGPLAWLYCWIIVAAFSIVLQYVAPIWIMPLFNKFVPLPEGELRTAITAYANRVGFAFRDILVMDGSRRSSKTNAFFTGFGANKRIGLFDTLVARHTVNELVAILAHEIGHYKKKHIPLMMVVSLVQLGIIFFLLSFFVSNRAVFDAFFMEEMSVYAGLLFFGIVYESVTLPLEILMNAVSRKHEFEADTYAVQTVGSSEDMISALKKLHVENLSNLTPHPFYVTLHYSHPPLIARITAIQAR